MSKEVQMTFRIEPELRADFIDAALQEHRPAAQVLREFMRTYVNAARERRNAPANDAISAAERRRREKAINFARSSIGLEGFTLSKTAEAQAQRFINGEIELAEFVQVNADAEPASSRQGASAPTNILSAAPQNGTKPRVSTVSKSLIRGLLPIFRSPSRLFPE